MYLYCSDCNEFSFLKPKIFQVDTKPLVLYITQFSLPQNKLITSHLMHALSYIWSLYNNNLRNSNFSQICKGISNINEHFFPTAALRFRSSRVPYRLVISFDPIRILNLI